MDSWVICFVGYNYLCNNNKKISLPPSLAGIHQLMHDNRTLSLKTMNTVRQMTLYPELIASVLYQASGSEVCTFSFLSSCVMEPGRSSA